MVVRRHGRRGTDRRASPRASGPWRAPFRHIAAAAVLAIAATGANAQPTFAEWTARITATDTLAPREAERQALRALYPAATARPLWTDGGQPTRQALQAIDVLGDVRARGLDPGAYALDALRATASERATAGADVERLARFDVALSGSLVRLLADLRTGRVDPRQLGFDLPNAMEALDLDAAVRSASHADDVAAVVAAAEPSYAGYVALTRALARYRALAADTALRLPPVRLARALRVGDSLDAEPALRRLLGALGDLDAREAGTTPRTAGGSASARRYDAPLAGAIARFQARHGLDADSILGAATLRQLRVPLAQRVRQIELTLERWRWLPHEPPERYVVVNIPSFRVFAFENDSAASRPVLTMDVIVGQAEGRHYTPVFTGTMREVVFRPYWDVPLNIARNEIIPIIRRSPGYMVREQLEIVHGGETDAVVYPPTAANLARVSAGTLRLRQRPGPNNSLGLVKFLFPNRYNVYLHGTPAQQLFDEARRDFSHGCIRIEDPPSMAAWVLAAQAGWDREAIDAAMHGTRTVHVAVQRPIAVYVLYATARADAAGTVYFYSDLYGHDAALERALGLPRVAAGAP